LETTSEPRIAAPTAHRFQPRPHPSRAQKSLFDAHLYAQGHGRMLRLKAQTIRCVVNRFEKTTRNYLATTTLATIELWLR
jgi:hypothetical protein